MKLAFNYFSAVTRKKSLVLRDALQKKGVELVSWKRLDEADGAIIYNIHSMVEKATVEALSKKKKILSLQEGMFARGWAATLSGMKQECVRANKRNIMHFVWSDLEIENYKKSGRDPKLMQCFGNPEHDLLLQTPKITRDHYGIPKDAVVVVHIDQYAHPKGGPNEDQMNHMGCQIKRLTNNKNVWLIRCLHPKQKTLLSQPKTKDRIIKRPFEYPIFDVLRMSDMVVSVSSTEAITAAILGKPLVIYDESKSPHRWPFVEHGVAKQADSYDELHSHLQDIINGSFSLSPKVNYLNKYQVDGKIADRVAENAIRYFKGKSI